MTEDLPGNQWEFYYHLDEGYFLVTGHINYTNRIGEVLETVGLNLTPNYPLLGELQKRLEIRGAAVGRQDVRVTYDDSGSFAYLHLNVPLAPGATANIILSFRLYVHPQPGLPENVWLLNSFLPMPAVYENGDWRHDLCEFCTDVVYSQSADFVINLHLPPDWIVAATGEVDFAYPDSEGLTRHTFKAGPVRDFAVAFSPNFQVQSREVGDIQVFIYFLPDQAESVQQVLSTAAEALDYYIQHFGPYPYPSLDLVALSGPGVSGMEYPGLVFLHYQPDQAHLEEVVAHEVAHQWWYGVVGNDVFREAWLDEALAEYSSVLYLQQVGETQTVQELLQTYQNAALRLEALSAGAPKVGSPVSAFPDYSTYTDVVYKKGAFFLHTLREEIGGEAFFVGLRQYYEWYQFGVGTGRGFLEAMQQASGKDLRTLFNEWVGLENLR